MTGPSVRAVGNCLECDFLSYAGVNGTTPICGGEARVDKARGLTQVELTAEWPPQWCPLREAPVLIRLRRTA